MMFSVGLFTEGGGYPWPLVPSPFQGYPSLRSIVLFRKEIPQSVVPALFNKTKQF